MEGQMEAWPDSWDLIYKALRAAPRMVGALQGQGAAGTGPQGGECHDTAKAHENT